jgi:hypothetical protein
MNEWILWIGGQFSPEDYLFWTRVQCLMWTAADVVIIVALARLANLARTREGARTHLFTCLVLAATIALAPFVILAPTGALIFVLELLITVPHFVLILYLLAANANRVARMLDDVLRARDAA